MIEQDPVFNDLSCKPLASDKYEASKRMESFVSVLNEFPQHGLGRSLRTTGNFYGLVISNGYSVSEWMFDPDSPQVERQLLSTLATKTPLLIGLDTSICEVAENREASCEHGASEALMVSHLINLPLVSLSHGPWTNPFIDCQISEIDDEGEINDSTQSLVNFSTHEHFTTHNEWLENRRKSDIQFLSDLWSHREILFPNLYFAKDVEAQLAIISDGSDLAAQVVDRLFDLERVAKMGSPFDMSAFRTTCSPTTSATLEMFASAYSFKNELGTIHLCGWHLKMQNGNRIYFADLGERYLIGHIGEHLPTKKFN